MDNTIKRKKAQRERLWGWAYASQGTINIPIAITTALIAIVGALVLTSAISNSPGLTMIRNQALILLFGLGVIVICANIDYTLFYKMHLEWIAMGIGVTAMAACLVLKRGEEIKRVLDLGVFTLEPSEILKFAMILFACFYAYKHHDDLQLEGLRPINKHDGIIKQIILGWGHKLNNGLFYGYTHTNEKGEKCVFFDDSLWYHLVLAFFILVPLAMIIISSHLSALIIYTVVALFILLNCGIKRKYLIIGLVAGVLAVLFYMYVIMSEYQRKRLTQFHYLPDAGTQSSAAIYAICSGGLFGKGFLNSAEKYGYLSEQHNDFIFSVFCEEFGFVGAVVLLLGFGLLVVMIYRQGKRAILPYASLSVQAIAVLLALQVLFHVGVNLSVLPNTGITLPFFSSGRSALLVTCAEIGYVMSVSCGTRYPTDNMAPRHIFSKLGDTRNRRNTRSSSAVSDRRTK